MLANVSIKVMERSEKSTERSGYFGCILWNFKFQETVLYMLSFAGINTSSFFNISIAETLVFLSLLQTQRCNNSTCQYSQRCKLLHILICVLFLYLRLFNASAHPLYLSVLFVFIFSERSDKKSEHSLCPEDHQVHPKPL